MLPTCTHVLCSDQPASEQEKEVEKSWVVWVGGRTSIVTCVGPETASKCWYSRLCCVGHPWSQMNTPSDLTVPYSAPQDAPEGCPESLAYWEYACCWAKTEVILCLPLARRACGKQAMT